MTEIWKEINGFPNYEISNLGNVRNKRTNHFLKGYENARGCIVVELGRKINSKRNVRLVHNLVLEAFVGVCSPGKKPHHKDGDVSNNVLSNLEWK